MIDRKWCANPIAAWPLPTDATTVNGATLRIVTRNGKVLVNGAEVLEADIQGSNGVIHIIDRVLVPAG